MMPERSTLGLSLVNCFIKSWVFYLSLVSCHSISKPIKPYRLAFLKNQIYFPNSVKETQTAEGHFLTFAHPMWPVPSAMVSMCTTIRLNPQAVSVCVSLYTMWLVLHVSKSLDLFHQVIRVPLTHAQQNGILPLHNICWDTHTHTRMYCM